MIVLLFTAGCFTTHHSLRNDQRVVASHAIGQCWQVRHDVLLVKVKALPNCQLEGLPARADAFDTANEDVVGFLPKGTHIRITDIEQTTFYPLKKRQYHALGCVEGGCLESMPFELGWSWSPPGVDDYRLAPIEE